MKFMQIIAAITAIVGLLSKVIDLISKKFFETQVFNRKVLYGFLYVATLALGLFLGSLIGYRSKQTEVRVIDDGPRISELTKTIDLLNGQLKEGQDQLLTSERSIDFIKGIIGKLNQKIVQYDDKFGIPHKARIILFEHVNYKGHGCYLTVDDEVPDLNLYGFGNRVSSIKLEGGARARVYSGINYSGSSWLVESDMSSLVDNNWNDKILSVSVEQKERH